MAMAQAMATSSVAMPVLHIRAQSLSHKNRVSVGVSRGLEHLLRPSSSSSQSCRLRCKSLNLRASWTSVAESEESSPEEGRRFSQGFFQALELAGGFFRRVREAVQKPQTEEEVQLLAAMKGRMVCAAAPVLFAAINQSVNTPLTVVASGMAKWLELYSGVLMVRVLLSWFPNIPWERQPLQAMRDMCDPYLNLFRNIIPPLFNALDLSPMLAFLVLGVLTSILNTTVQAS